MIVDAAKSTVNQLKTRIKPESTMIYELRASNLIVLEKTVKKTAFPKFGRPRLETCVIYRVIYFYYNTQSLFHHVLFIKVKQDSPKFW